MAVRNSRSARSAQGGTTRKAAPATSNRRTRPAAEEEPEAPARRRGRPAKATSAKAAPRAKAAPDVTMYADKPPTDFHKAFAKWIVEEVGFDPDSMKSKRGAFLMGVSIASAARPAFQSSEWLANWREENGVTKVGRKSAAERAEGSRRGNRAVVTDDEFDPDEVEEDEDLDEDDTDADESDDDTDWDEDSDDDDESDDDDSDEGDDDEDDDDDDEVEEAPPARTRRTKAAPAKGRTAAAKPAPRKTTAKPAAAGRRKAAPADDFAF